MFVRRAPSRRHYPSAQLSIFRVNKAGWVILAAMWTGKRVKMKKKFHHVHWTWFYRLSCSNQWKPNSINQAEYLWVVFTLMCKWQCYKETPTHWDRAVFFSGLSASIPVSVSPGFFGSHVADSAVRPKGFDVGRCQQPPLSEERVSGLRRWFLSGMWFLAAFSRSTTSTCKCGIHCNPVFRRPVTEQPELCAERAGCSLGERWGSQLNLWMRQSWVTQQEIKRWVPLITIYSPREMWYTVCMRAEVFYYIDSSHCLFVKFNNSVLLSGKEHSRVFVSDLWEQSFPLP